MSLHLGTLDARRTASEKSVASDAIMVERVAIPDFTVHEQSQVPTSQLRSLSGIQRWRDIILEGNSVRANILNRNNLTKIKGQHFSIYEWYQCESAIDFEAIRRGFPTILNFYCNQPTADGVLNLRSSDKNISSQLSLSGPLGVFKSSIGGSGGSGRSPTGPQGGAQGPTEQYGLQESRSGTLISIERGIFRRLRRPGLLQEVGLLESLIFCGFGTFRGAHPVAFARTFASQLFGAATIAACIVASFGFAYRLVFFGVRRGGQKKHPSERSQDNADRYQPASLSRAVWVPIAISHWTKKTAVNPPG
jgi:hypothetical protein